MGGQRALADVALGMGNGDEGHGILPVFSRGRRGERLHGQEIFVQE
jgi:hypothetical protein